MSALVKQLRLLQAWYLPAGPEPEEAMPSKYRAFKEAADRIVELERDLAAANAKLAAKPDVAGLVKEMRELSQEYCEPAHRGADALLSISAQLQEKEAECEVLQEKLTAIQDALDYLHGLTTGQVVGLRQDAEVGKFIRAHLNHGDMSIRVITDVDKHGIPVEGTELIWTDPEDIDAAIAARKP